MGHETNFAALYSQLSSFQRERGLDLMAVARPQPGETVLDLGCGTGGLTSILAQRVGPRGTVIGIDPDGARLTIARASRAPTVSNLIYMEGRGEDMRHIASNSVDLVYSNYAVHWIADKVDLMREVARCLRPGGRVAFELVGEIAPIFVEVSDLSGDKGQELLSNVTCLSERQWRALLVSQGFIVREATNVEVPYFFPSLDDFYSWWEATTHGAFRRSSISAGDDARLRASFVGGRRFTCLATRVVARKAR